MEIKSPHKNEFRAGITKALLSNTPAAMDLSVKYGLTPAEVGTLMYDALLHMDGLMDCEAGDLPITAKPPSEFMSLTPTEIRMRLSGHHGFDRMGDC